ncbi:hypothetical protein [Piscinibacter sakaiensis]|uniref:hypothetical protein n=1 Tax=Piscinibacter sakaiensis TaxID=1547922 RepID=UPI003AAF6E62
MRFAKTIVLLLAATFLSGCYTVVRPTIAHVHLGHTLSGWVDTPERIGLLEVAEREAAVAAEQAAKAHQSGRNPAELKRHVDGVLHALDPKLVSQGPGTGYGLIRAIEGGTDHLKFAADSPDASKNLKDSVLGLESTASKVRQGARVGVAICQEIRASNKPEDLVSLAEELKTQTASLVRDTKGWRSQIEEMVGRENPPFSQIERRYLFGLIRLPNGLWQWHPDVDKAGSQGIGTSGYR